MKFFLLSKNFTCFDTRCWTWEGGETKLHNILVNWTLMRILTPNGDNRTVHCLYQYHNTTTIREIPVYVHDIKNITVFTCVFVQSNKWLTSIHTFTHIPHTLTHTPRHWVIITVVYIYAYSGLDWFNVIVGEHQFFFNTVLTETQDGNNQVKNKMDGIHIVPESTRSVFTYLCILVASIHTCTI